MPTTNEDIFEKLGEVSATCTSIKERLDRDTERLDKHDGRIGGLERSRAKIWGAGGVLAVLASSLGWDEMMRLFK